jgi:hypothetical protein
MASCIACGNVGVTMPLLVGRERPGMGCLLLDGLLRLDMARAGSGL